MNHYLIKIYDRPNRNTYTEEVKVRGKDNINEALEIISKTLEPGSIIIGVEQVWKKSPTKKSTKR